MSAAKGKIKYLNGGKKVKVEGKPATPATPTTSSPAKDTSDKKKETSDKKDGKG
jgi:hypothetical protein